MIRLSRHRSAAERSAIGAAAALLLTVLTPGPALALGNGQGSVPSCTRTGSANVVLGSPAQVNGDAMATCYVPGTTAGRTFGPTKAWPPPPRAQPKNTFKPGDTCTFVVNQPDTFSPPATLHSQFFGAGWGEWYPNPVQADAITQILDTKDAFEPFLVTGTFDSNGFCTNTNLIQSLCLLGRVAPTQLPGGAPMCWVFRLPPQPLIMPGGLNPGGVTLQILQVMGSIKGLVQPGTIKSRPDLAGLVNTPTCFYVDGMNIPQSQAYDVVLEGPDMGEGRHLFFTFRIEVSYQGTRWDFGDGSSEEVAPPADLCGGSTAQLQTAHVYRHYSQGQPSDAYHVTANATYGVHVSEAWIDADGMHGLDLGNGGVPPFTVVTRPYLQRILQAQGVPVSG